MKLHISIIRVYKYRVNILLTSICTTGERIYQQFGNYDKFAMSILEFHLQQLTNKVYIIEYIILL